MSTTRCAVQCMCGLRVASVLVRSSVVCLFINIVAYLSVRVGIL